MRAILLAALVLFAAADAQAAGGRWRQATVTPVHAQQVPNRYYQRSAYANAVYPRYTAGFHARYYENIGIPTGDIGLRGNSIFLNPW